MKDDSKTKTELIDELKQLRQRVHDLESSFKESKTSSASMQEDEEQFRLLFNNAPLGYQSLDEFGNFIEVNDTWCQMLGYTKDEVLGRNFSEFIHPDFKEHFKQNFPRFKKIGYILGVEFEMVKKDGSEIIVSFNGKIGQNQDGSFRQTHCILRDITVIKQAEEALRESEQKYHYLFNNSLVGFGISDIEGNILHVNNALCNITGYSLDEIFDEKVHSFYARSEDRQILLKELEQNGHTENLELKFRRKSGDIFWVLLSSKKITYEGKEAILTSFIDIDERKKAEIALNETRHFTDNLIQTSNALIIGLDINGKINLFNEAAEKITGYTKSKLEDKNWFETLVPLDRYPRVHEEFNRLSEGGTPKLYTNPILTKDGQERIIAWSNNVVKQNGEVVGIISFGIDITEQRQAEEALRKSEEKFSKVFHSSPDSVTLTSIENGQIVEANKGFERLTGYSREEALGKTTLQLGIWHNPVDRERLIELLKECSVIHEMEIELCKKSGEIITCLLSAEDIDIQGQRCLLSVTHDITERKMAEEKLKNSEKRSSAWLNNSPVCTKIVDLDFNLQYMSAAGIKELKIDDISQFYGKPYPFYFYPDSFRNIMTKNLEKVKETGEIITQEAPVVDIEGNELWFHSTLVPVNDDKGQIEYIIVVSAETTERKQAEDGLKEKEEQLRTVMEASPDYIWHVDTEFRILFCNRSGPTLSMEDLIGTPIYSLLPENEQQEAKRTLKLALESKGQYRYEYNGQRSDGSQISYENIAVPMISDGKVVGLTISSRDITERILAEDRLQSEMEFTETALNAQLDTFFIFDPVTGKPIRWNKTVKEITGYSDTEIAALNTPIDLYDGDDQKKAVAAIEKIKKDGKATVELSLVTKNGRRIPYEYNASIINDGEGNPKHIISIGRNITERKKAEDKIRKSESKRQAIFHHAPLAMAQLDMEGHPLITNPALEKLVGYDKKELRNMIFTEFTHPEDAQKDMDLYLELLEGKRDSYQMEKRYFHKDGSLIWGNLNVGIVRDNQGQPDFIIGMVENITDRRQAEEELRRYASIVSSSNDMLALLDKNYYYLAANETYLNAFKLTKNELIGNTAADLFGNAFFENTIRPNADKCLCGEEVRFHGLIDFPAKKQRYMEVTFYPYYGLDNEVIGFVVNGRDTTDRKQAEEALLESESKYKHLFDKMIDGFALHEIICDETGKPIDYRFLAINPAFERLTGLKAADLIGKRAYEALPGLEPLWAEKYGDVALTGNPIHFEEYSEPLKKYFEISAYRPAEGQFACIFVDITDRKLSEKALAKSEAFLSDTGRMAKVGGWELDAKTFDLRFTDEIYIIHGLPIDKTPSLDEAINFYYPEERPRLTDAIQRALEFGEPYDMELRFITADGKHLWIHTTCTPVVRDGKTVKLTGTFQDITESKAAEEALKKSEEKYRTVIENSPGVFWTSDEDGHTSFISKNIEDIYGYTQEEIYQYGEQLWFGRIHPDDIDNVTNSFNALIKSHQPYDIQYRIQKKDGNWIWLHDEALNTYDHMGKMRVDGIFSDITEHKIAEEQIRMSEEKLKSITMAANDAILMANDQGEIVFWNPTAEEIFGYSKEEAISVTLWNIVIPERYIEKISKRILKFGKIGDDHSIGETFEMTFKRKSGEEFPVEISLSSLKLANRWHSVALIRDITEIKRLRELESRAERLKTAGQIAGQVAHDFNNLLGPLIAYPELARGELPEDHPVLSYLVDIERSAQQIAEINQQLLTLGRRSHYNQEPLNINDIINDVLYEMDSPPSTLILETDLDNDLMNVMAGRAQINRALFNMINNARDSMQNMGSLSIKSENIYTDDVSIAYGRIPMGEYVKVTISDTGCGIPEDIVQKIFDPFFTTKSTDKKRGSGLGLSIVDAVVKDHGGYIDLKSSIGKGTTFYLYFPITRQSVTELESNEIVEGSGKILIVDDDEMQRKVTINLLQNLGYDVNAVDCGERAIDYIKTNPHDLLILDMVMPEGIDGTETYRRVLEINPKQKAIIVSGFAETDKVQAAQRMGAGAYIRKPLTRQSIAEAIQDELNRVVTE
jgi:PAS domain S-box-containing protein